MTLGNGLWRLRGHVDLFDLDPELVSGATGPLLLRLFSLSRGHVQAPPALGRALNHPFLVVKGVLRKDLSVCGRRSAELVAPGDCVTFDRDPIVETLAAHAEWVALEDTLLAALNPGEACPANLAQTITSALVVRATDRADRLALQHAICSHVRVDVRLLAYLWYLADRFGVVTPNGIRLNLALTHSTLAQLIGARRPTVTTAIRRLIEQDFVRRDGRDFVLLGGPDGVDRLVDSGPVPQSAMSSPSALERMVGGDVDAAPAALQPG